MNKLPTSHYSKVKHLIKSNNEISVFGVIDEIAPGEIYVNNIGNPTCALIKTSECNLVTGTPDDGFITQISSELGFWDTVTPDSSKWFDKIPMLHKNKFIRPFKRHKYTLSKEHFSERITELPEGFTLEKVDLDALRSSSYKNAELLLDWIADWLCDKSFNEQGAGQYIRNDDTIVSWSFGDCYYDDEITIGVYTDRNFRKHGFGIQVVSETVKECFAKGYKTINWLCVETNLGSISIAKKLGLVHANDYYFFCSFLPSENLHDISESEWLNWAKYLEESSAQEPRLIEECLYTYFKANNVAKAIEIIGRIEVPKMSTYKRDVTYFRSMGLCSNFSSAEWLEFVGRDE